MDKKRDPFQDKLDINKINDEISVILPIYNVEKYLECCIESVLNQTYSNLEIILIDDGATDRCGHICDEYSRKDKRVIVYHKKNGGLSDARNYGIANATGKYITCIDADDYVDSDYVEYLYKMILKYNTRMSICQHRVRYDNGHIIERGTNGSEVLDNKKCIERMLYHDVIDTSAWGKLYERTLFETVKFPEGRLFEDIATTYKLMLQCEKIAVGYASKYNYICRKTSIVNCSFNIKKFDLVDMTDAMGEEVVVHYPDLCEAVMRRRVYARISTLNQMLRTQQYEDKRFELLQFIYDHKKEVFKNKKTPHRDKIALFILTISYPLYRFVWLSYQKLVLDK